MGISKEIFGDRSERRRRRISKLYRRHKKIHKLLRRYGQDIIDSENFKSTQGHLQHGNMTVHNHCMDVARYSLLINKKLGIHCNKRDLVRGALLHDYFLYDWHDKEALANRQKLHGFHHPATALQNAEKEYRLNARQRDIISKHMWPLSVVPPMCREAWVVTAADKYCSLMETLKLHKGHGKRIVRKPEEERQGLYSALSAYAESDCYPYHMPGHKRSPQAGELSELYRIDITEIDGFDNLHQPEGILLEAQQRANSLYGSEETFFMVNGSTGGILASIMAVSRPGDELLIMRDCHKSVYHGALMQGLTLRYLKPHIISEYDICDAADVGEVEEQLRKYPRICAVVITSPTYEGIVSDLRAIADVVHKQNRILIVDEAHGAHLKPRKQLTEPGGEKEELQDAISAGADLVIHSLHKTLPSMTQTALLHRNGTRVDVHRLRRCLSMVQSSSPSYVLMASMDSCISYLMEHGAERFRQMEEQYDVFCRRMEGCRHIRIGTDRGMRGQKRRMTGWDPGKIVISVKGCSMTGRQLYDILREEYRLQMEMAAESYVLAMMTLMDTEQGWQRLADALEEIDARIEESKEYDTEATEIGLYDGELPKSRQTMTEAFYAKQEWVLLKDAAGRIAGDFVNLYPPGIPLAVPGEEIEQELIEKLEKCLLTGLTVQGITPEKKLRVLAR